MNRGALVSGLISISVYFNKEWFLNRLTDFFKKNKIFEINRLYDYWCIAREWNKDYNLLIFCQKCCVYKWEPLIIQGSVS